MMGNETNRNFFIVNETNLYQNFDKIDEVS